MEISIHALLAESDGAHEYIFKLTPDFYPRSPCGERLFVCLKWYNIDSISIHALLAESDASYLTLAGRIAYFYPRSPCGERRIERRYPRRGNRFLSTLSLRRATIYTHPIGVLITISIHALLAESDFTSVVSSAGTIDFYPRSPCGERRVHYDNYNLHCVISIHALLAESDVSGSVKI